VSDIDELIVELRSTMYHSDLLLRAAQAIEDARQLASQSHAAGYHQRDQELREEFGLELAAMMVDLMPSLVRKAIGLVDAHRLGLKL
jgi:hypothetical protein